MAKTTICSDRGVGSTDASANTENVRKVVFEQRDDYHIVHDVPVITHYQRLEATVPQASVQPTMKDFLTRQTSEHEERVIQPLKRRNTSRSAKHGFSEWFAISERLIRDKRGKVIKVETRTYIFEVRALGNGMFRVTAVYELTPEIIEKTKANRAFKQERSLDERMAAVFGGRRY